MYNSLKWPLLNIRRHIHWLQLISECVHLNYPHYLQQFLVPCSLIYQLRHSTQYSFSIPIVRKAIGKRTFMFEAP